MNAEIRIWLPRMVAAVVMCLGLSVIPSCGAPQPAAKFDRQAVLLEALQTEAEAAAAEAERIYAAMPDSERVRGDAEVQP